jgi:hypothetical protein
MNEHIKSLYPWARNYAKGGPKRDKFYNTQLTPQQEQQYQKWVQTLPLNLRSDYDYDLRGAWLNGDLPDRNYHMIDKWKKPWHPTFSNESIYSTQDATGGSWENDTFVPSTINKIANGFKYGQWGANSFNLYDTGGDKKGPWHPPMSTYSISGTQPAGTVMSNPYSVRKSQPVAWSGLMKQLNTSLAANTGAYVPVIDNGVPSYFRYINNTSNMTKSSDPVAYQRNRLHFVENNANVGYDPITKRYVAYDSVEGGEQTIGDGLKLYPNEAWTKLYNRQGYLTKQQHDDFINARIRKDIEATRRFYDTTNNDVGAFDRLSPEMQAWLIDYNYNPGITQFPKLVKAIYVDDKDSIRKESARTVGGKPLGRNKIMLNDLDLIESGQYTGSYASGGSIHIKPENRGKFTAAANRAGKSVQAYASQILANKDHYSTTLVKRANFAKNAKKFHH